MVVDNCYCLVMEAGRFAPPRIIEFEARGAEAALLAAERYCVGRKAEVFENGRSLGKLESVADGGYWIITPPGPKAAAGGRSA